MQKTRTYRTVLRKEPEGAYSAVCLNGLLPRTKKLAGLFTIAHELFAKKFK